MDEFDEAGDGKLNFNGWHNLTKVRVLCAACDREMQQVLGLLILTEAAAVIEQGESKPDGNEPNDARR